MPNHNIKLIIIDFYGMMSLGSYEDTCHWITKKYKFDYDHAYDIMYHKLFTPATLGKMSERQFYERTAKELGLKENWKQLKKIHQSFHKLNKSVFKYCVHLQNQGYTIVLLSKNLPGQFAEELKKMHVRKYFKNIINTFDLKLPKSSKKTIQYVLNIFNVKPKEVVMIDDQDFNLPEAKKLGVHTIYYENFSKFRREMTRLLK